MKKAILLLLLLLPTILHAQQAWQPTSYDISFKIKNAGLTVKGRFATVKAKLLFDPAKPDNGSLSATAEVATIKTGINKRDKDLLEEKYFDTAHHKQIVIKSASLYAKGAQFAGMFDVTIKGITKKIEIPFEFNQIGNEAEFKGSFNINRVDFNVGGENMIMQDNVTVAIVVKTKKV